MLANLAVDAEECADATATAAGRSPHPAQRVRELERRSLVAEVACALRLPERTAECLIDEAESLVCDLPATLESLGSGTISYRHAQRLIDHALSLPAETRPAFESVALPLAARLTPARFDARARRLRERMHPDSIAERACRAADERTVSLEPARDGMAWLHALLPAAPAAEAFARVRAAAAGLARIEGEQRTEAQLRADVLSDLLTGRAEAPEPGESAQPGEAALRGDAARGTSVATGTGRFARTRPTVFVTVPVMTLLGAGDEPGELHGAGPIDADTARELAARAPSFIRILTHPETGARLSIGRDRYAVPSDLRAALVTRDETCRFPGCGRAAEQCEVDHVADWAHGGRTDATNLAMLCPKHHHLKHETGWSSAPGPDPGSIEWRSPTGRRHTSDPPEQGAPVPQRPERSRLPNAPQF
ncbi:HNH endonuclease signature motif containing protein [Agromyces sp. SYSU T00194]|uniref:HNH endonuclease signature motif containing protein n=1 Tax=Agromyces chitinivorans TaxID=3158560 RepID=UPI0033950080